MINNRTVRSKSARTSLFLSTDGHCYYCKCSLEEGWHTDHVLAWSKGGKTVFENLVPACPKCNLAKGTKDVNVFNERVK